MNSYAKINVAYIIFLNKISLYILLINVLDIFNWCFQQLPCSHKRLKLLSHE